jgi:hypothetical protein
MKARIYPKHRWPYTRLHNTTSALKVHFNVPQNEPESTRCSLTHGYNILVHKFVYKASITRCSNYFKPAMILRHVVCPSVCRFVFVSMETKLKSQIHTITQPDGSYELNWNAPFGWRFGVISCLLRHDAFKFFEGGLVQVLVYFSMLATNKLKINYDKIEMKTMSVFLCLNCTSTLLLCFHSILLLFSIL